MKCAASSASALPWLDRYHIDGLRRRRRGFDALPSITRARKRMDPNKYGGRENLEAIDFLRRPMICSPLLSRRTDHRRGIDRVRRVSKPVKDAAWLRLQMEYGLMHDTLELFKQDPFTGGGTIPAHLPQLYQYNGEIYFRVFA